MRIAFVASEYVTEKIFDGGLANYLQRVSLSLMKLGHEPIIFVTSDKSETIFHNGIEIHRVDVSSSLENLIDKLTKQKFKTALDWAWQSYKLNNALKKFSKSKPINIIQYASYTGTGVFRLKKIPSVVRLSSYEPMWREACGIKTTFDNSLCDKIECLAFRRADSLFGPSKIIASVVEKLVNKQVKIIETPFILDTDKLDEKIYQDLLKDKKYLLFFGRVGPLKGVKVIAKIIYNLLEINKELYFVFVGTNEHDENGSMIEQVYNSAKHHKDRIIYTNKLRHEQLYPIINNAFAAVLPSRIDNFPNTCLEAMVHKRVVIGTKGASFEQLLNDGESGFLCNNDDPDDLLLTIKKVLNLDDKNRQQIGEKAYLRVQQLKPEIVVSQLLDYYETIIQAKTKS